MAGALLPARLAIAWIGGGPDGFSSLRMAEGLAGEAALDNGVSADAEADVDEGDLALAAE